MHRRGFLGMFGRAPLVAPLLASSALAAQPERVTATLPVLPPRTVPASGRHAPSKQDIRTLFAEMQRRIDYLG